MNGSIINTRYNPYMKAFKDPPSRKLNDFAVTFLMSKSPSGYYGSYDNAVLTRSWDSINFEFKPQTPESEGYSDFDAYMPWRGMRVCNLSIDGEVAAYQEDIAFSRTPETGNVMVEIPKFYYVFEYQEEGDVKSLTLHVSPDEHEGWYVSPRHQKWGSMTKDYDKIYISAYYPVADGRSISGGYPYSSTYLFETQKKVGENPGYYQEDLLTEMTLEILRLVEMDSFDMTQYGSSPNQTHYNMVKVTNGQTDAIAYPNARNGDYTSRYTKYRHIENPYIYTQPGNQTIFTGTFLKNGYLYISHNPLLLFEVDGFEKCEYKLPYPSSWTEGNTNLRVNGSFRRENVPDPLITKYDFSLFFIPEDFHGSHNYHASHISSSDIGSYVARAYLGSNGINTGAFGYFYEYQNEISIDAKKSGNFNTRFIYLPPEK